MASRKVSYLELELTDVDKFSRIVCSPPFAKETLNDRYRYWQLVIRPKESECTIYIEALDGAEDPDIVDSFIKLRRFFRITVKDLDGNDIAPERNVNALVKIFSRSSLCGIVVVGIEMVSTKFDPRVDKVNLMNMMKYIEPLSKDYTITEELSDQIDVVLGPALDVKFKVQNHPLFASSKILSKLSPYLIDSFEKQDQGSRSGLTDEKGRESKGPFRHIYQEIDIDERFSYNSILCMVQIAYTGNITTSVRPEHMEEILLLSNQFQIPALEAPLFRMLDDVNIYNAAELYFGYSWMLPKMKNKLKRYIIGNFSQIIKTDAYNNLLKNHKRYPMFLEMYEEILINLCSSG
ncbi:8960_t:CDS:2 [Acaulospora morrowiae]|uniref:8960_t:CDS:1 n=1 Tax=Acaulospora morrowiae TaxID=94023 RepID=A0A9N9G1G0_9GLOM|nr:8960_t:CDS:2 [Acaulospora morrowiae]